MSSTTFFGVSHVDLPVTDLERSLRLYATATGFPVRARGEGFADVDTGGVLLRLVETRKPEHHASIRLQAGAIEGGLAALIEAGAASLYAPMRTPSQELVGAVRDPDGHTIYVWRALSEDEYDHLPALPTKLTWDPEADALLRSLLKRVPALFRMLARFRVTRVAEDLAEQTRRVSREEVIRAYILASPRVTRGRNRQPLIDHGIDVDRYGADWAAD